MKYLLSFFLVFTAFFTTKAFSADNAGVCFEALVNKAPMALREELLQTLEKIPILKKDVAHARKTLENYQEQLAQTKPIKWYMTSVKRIARQQALENTDSASTSLRDLEEDLNSAEERINNLIEEIYKLDSRYDIYQEYKRAKHVAKLAEEYLESLEEFKGPMNVRLFLEGLDAMTFFGITGGASSLHYFFAYRKKALQVNSQRERLEIGLRSVIYGIPSSERDVQVDKFGIAGRDGLEGVDSIGDVFLQGPMFYLNSVFASSTYSSVGGITLDHISVVNILLTLKNYWTTYREIKKTKDQMPAIYSKISELHKKSLELICGSMEYCETKMNESINPAQEQ